MPGTYAPPAVDEPNTTDTVGMPAFDSAVRSRNVRPPGTKMSACTRRSAPADSVRLMTGRRFSRAICSPRCALSTEYRFDAPPLTVGSLAVTRHATPATQPMPCTIEPPGWNSLPQPMSGCSSRNGLSRSSSRRTRSRTGSFPRSRWRATRSAPPPAAAAASASSSCATSARLAARLRPYAAEPGSTAEDSTSPDDAGSGRGAPAVMSARRCAHETARPERRASRAGRRGARAGTLRAPSPDRRGASAWRRPGRAGRARRS